MDSAGVDEIQAGSSRIGRIANLFSCFRGLGEVSLHDGQFRLELLYRLRRLLQLGQSRFDPAGGLTNFGRFGAEHVLVAGQEAQVRLGRHVRRSPESNPSTQRFH